MDSIKFRGMEVSPIGIGTAAWGGGINGGDQMYGSRLSANDLSYIFRTAVAQDINFFDTSPAFGTSETALGYASKSNQSVHFSTKFVPSSFQRRNALRKSAEHSMSILGVDSLNFFGIQMPIDVDKWVKELIPLLDDGTIKNAGVSNFNLSEIKKAQFILERAGHSLSYVQSHYSIVSNSERDEGIIDWCKENDALFFAYMVLEQGALTRKYSTSSMFESKSYRASLYNRTLMNSLAPLKMQMQKLSDSYSVSDAQIAIAWSVGRGAIPIVGVTRSSQIKGVVTALDLILDEDDMQMLEDTANSIKIKIRGFWELDR
ncbi:MAG TPA: aldo/keto reductase [Candidatus Methanomethylophilaceae archaeon]|nr:aldo/keto reductase [Candidatus Methanomethylophilaceae archaeon]